MENLMVKKIFDNAILPTRGTDESAGLDLYAYIPEDKLDPEGKLNINPHETVPVSSGIAIGLPPNTFGGIVARSGMAKNRHLAPANKLGVVDRDYTGEVIILLHNHSNDIQSIENGERIAQLLVLPYINTNVLEVNTLQETLRGDGGFGSTGEK